MNKTTVTSSNGIRLVRITLAIDFTCEDEKATELATLIGEAACKIAEVNGAQDVCSQPVQPLFEIEDEDESKSQTRLGE